MAITLTQEQSAVVRNRGGELLVSAAAGSGKTRVLVERLLSRVQDEGLDLDQFLVITFTRDTAAELRDKVLAELNRRLAQTPDDRHLRRQTTLIYRAQISTIHAFCTVFLRENSHLLDLDPDFRVADETESSLLLAQTLERLLETRYEELDHNQFARLVDAFSAGRDDNRLKSIVLDIYGRIQSAPDPIQWLDQRAADFDLRGYTDAGQTQWGTLLMEDTAAQVRYWYDKLQYATELILESGDDYLIKAYSDSFHGTLDSLAELEDALHHSWDDAQRAMNAVSFARLGTSRKITEKDIQAQVKALREGCKKALSKLAQRFDCSSRELLEDMEAVRLPVEELFTLVKDLHLAFASAKKRRKLLDFNDLEHFTVKALLCNGQPTELAQRWAAKFAEVMVDEYQDTNEVQNAIFDALTNNGKTLFQVGDMKQSIYRFRLADPTIFLHKYHTFRPADQAKDGEPRLLVLSRNFRSRKQVLDSVNFLFENIMTTLLGELDYTSDQRLNLGLTDAPIQQKDCVELDVVDLSTVESKEDEADLPRDEVEARFVAKRVRQLLDKPFMVAEGEGFRPVRPEDIAILHRSPTSVLRYLTKAMDDYDIPWQTDNQDDIFRSTEISVVLSFLQIIDNPRQDVPLISVLRSPVYAFTPDQLAILRATCKEGDFYTCITTAAAQGDSHCQKFLTQLEALRLRMVDSSCAQMIWYLYDQLGLMSLFGAMAGGQRRQENLLAFYEYAHSFEGQGHRGVFALVHQLRRLIDSGNHPNLSSTSARNGVQIKSIHRSKGLEFPVVVLAGLNRSFNSMDETLPMVFHPKLGVGPKLLDAELRVEYSTLARSAVQLKLNREMKSEEMRLLYVAMTRAQEKLILVMSFKDAPKELGKLMEDAGAKPAPEAMVSMNSLAKWILLPVLARQDSGALWFGNPPEYFIRSNDHWSIQLVKADSTCFAPTDTERDSTADMSTPTDNANAQPADEPPSAQGLETLAKQLLWSYPRQALANLPSKVTATQIKGRLLDEEATEEATQPPRPLEFRKPSFEQAQSKLTRAQAGSAIHAVMEHINLRRAHTVTGVREEIQRLTDAHFLTPEQAQVVNPYQVAHFWSSPLGQQAASSPTLKREFKFSILYPAAAFYPESPMDEQVLLQGVIDCCFESEEGFTVVDFKSDYLRHGEEAEHAERYRAQLDIYTHALEEIYQKPVTKRVLWFFSTDTGITL